MGFGMLLVWSPLTPVVTMQQIAGRGQCNGALQAGIQRSFDLADHQDTAHLGFLEEQGRKGRFLVACHVLVPGVRLSSPDRPPERRWRGQSAFGVDRPNPLTHQSLAPFAPAASPTPEATPRLALVSIPRPSAPSPNRLWPAPDTHHRSLIVLLPYLFCWSVIILFLMWKRN